MERPELVEQKHLDYLDDLRKSAETNMFGAGSFLQDEFGVDTHDASKILKYWMDSFGDDDR